MRHLFNKWASYNQLLTTSNNQSQNSFPVAMSSYQEVPIIEEEEEEFDVDNEGSFCLVSIDIGQAFFPRIFIDFCD